MCRKTDGEEDENGKDRVEDKVVEVSCGFQKRVGVVGVVKRSFQMTG